MHVGVIGTGYVGLVVGACLAETGNTVICADIDEQKIRKLKKGVCPIYEPGLEPLIQHNLSEKRLVFTIDVGQAVRDSEIIFIAVGTPSDSDGSAYLRSVLEVAETIGSNVNVEIIIITKSTVPVGTANKVRETIEALTDQTFHVCSNPEFLREGAAVSDFMKPDRVVIGVESDYPKQILEELYSPFIRTGNPIIFMDIASAEITKYAANSMLSVRISFINQIAALCEQVGADIDLVRRGIGSDPRIGAQFLFAGAGYGGSCFPKDARALIRTAKEYGVNLSIVDAANEWNERQKVLVIEKLKAEYGDDLNGRKIAVWGLSFKPETDDMREAPSLMVLPELIKSGATVIAHDPRALEIAKGILSKEIRLVSDEYLCCKDADALIILTEWQQYRRPDLERVRDSMARPVVVDGRNLFSPEKMKERGFIYYSIGRRTAK